MTSLVRLTAALCLVALSGCAPLSVAGHTEGYSEVFRGTGVNEGASSRWEAVLEPTGVRCSATATAIGVASWNNRIVCDDGRTAIVDTQSVDLAMSSGTGKFADGSPLTIVRGIDDRPHRQYLEYRTRQQTRIASNPPAPSTRPQGAESRPGTAPAPVSLPRGRERPDDIAVIIGNANYGKLGRDIPDVKPAHADADGIRRYVLGTLGIREGNLIFLKDATVAQMTRVFGTEREPRGQLWDWVKPGKSRVFVYYSGHGAPGSEGGTPYLVPIDADAARIELNGYPLKTLYDNLGRLPAESVTVVLEACFSGTSPAGSVVASASPILIKPKLPDVPANLTVIAAGASDQMASWEADASSGLFTKYFLQAMSGEADANRDGNVSLDELDAYLKDTLTYFARRHWGRDQTAQIVRGRQPSTK